MQGILEQSFVTSAAGNSKTEVFGEKIGIFATLFGCWHKDLGRPFSDGKESHRSCTQCGARRHFDSQTLKTFGPFYYPRQISDIN